MIHSPRNYHGTSEKKKRPQRGIQEKNNKTSQHLTNPPILGSSSGYFLVGRGHPTKVEAKTLESHSVKGPPRFGPIPSGPWTIPPHLHTLLLSFNLAMGHGPGKPGPNGPKKSDEQKLKLFFHRFSITVTT